MSSGKSYHFEEVYSMKKILICILACLFLTSCYTLKEPVVTINHPIEEYKFIYITPTETLTAGAGGVYGNEYGTYGSTTTKTVNSSDVISGILMKEGFVRLPEIREDLVSETIIVNYGESGKRVIAGGLGGYTIEVTIRFLSA